MFDSLKNKANKMYMDVAVSLKTQPKDSSFYDTGKLTPDEFIDAGDQLTFVCPSWVWKPAADAKLKVNELAADKQYISTRVMSNKRIKQVFNEISTNFSEVDGWILTENKDDKV